MPYCFLFLAKSHIPCYVVLVLEYMPVAYFVPVASTTVFNYCCTQQSIVEYPIYKTKHSLFWLWENIHSVKLDIVYFGCSNDSLLFRTPSCFEQGGYFLLQLNLLFVVAKRTICTMAIFYCIFQDSSCYNHGNIEFGRSSYLLLYSTWTLSTVLWQCFNYISGFFLL